MASPRVPGWGFLLEGRRRLSASFLWELQRAFYEREGADAWRSRGVPSYVTSNPFVAGRYARVIHSLLAERRGDASGAPLHVVELAAGSGELGFHLARELEELLAAEPLPGCPRPRLVLTDLAERNVTAWLAEPALAPFFERGLLDVARFDAASDGELHLRRSGEVLRPGASPHPLVCVAHYLLDSLPQDAFAARGGRLFERPVNVTSSRPEPDLADPRALVRMRLRFEEAPAGPAPYGEPELDGLLAEYAARLQDAAFLWPVVALRLGQRLWELAGGRLVWLVADKATSTLEELEGQGDPHVALHDGCFSLAVDLYALGRWAERRGGAALLPSRRADVLELGALVGPDSVGARTRRLLSELVEGFGPSDYLTLVDRRASAEAVEPEALLALLRLGGDDPWVVARLGPRVPSARLAAAAPGLAAQLEAALTRASARHYPLVGPADLAEVCARLRAGLGSAGASQDRSAGVS